MYKLPNSKGFTLMELLVVISIISILSAILYASFSDARQDAKNKAIQSEMKEVQLAIELYKSQNGVYPPPDFSVMCHSTASGVHTTTALGCGTSAYIDGLLGEFISELPSPSDSANTVCDFEYQVDADGIWYKLVAEKCHAGAEIAAEGVQYGDEFAQCLQNCSAGTPCDSIDEDTVEFYESYAIYSDGGQCK